MGQSVSPVGYRLGRYGCWTALGFYSDSNLVYMYFVLNSYLVRIFNTSFRRFGFFFGHSDFKVVDGKVSMYFYIYYNPIQYFFRKLFYRGYPNSFRRRAFFIRRYVLERLAALWSGILSRFFNRGSFSSFKFLIVPIFVSRLAVPPSVLCCSISRKFLYRRFSFGRVVSSIVRGPLLKFKRLGGLRFSIAGRFMRRQRSISNSYSVGRVPTGSVGVPVPYFCFVAVSRYGSFSIRVFFSHKLEVFRNRRRKKRYHGKYYRWW